MGRRPLLAGNWKMHKGPEETSAFLEGLVAEDLPGSVDVLVCPPMVSLPVAAMVLTASDVSLGAQNVHWEASGAFTGEVSAAMLAEVGASHCIVGHSERRTFFGESDETAGRRAAAAQDAGLVVVFCVGETLDEREAGETFAVLERQLEVLRSLDPAKLIVAYEPVWAIGTGRTATTDQAQEAHAWIRRHLEGFFGEAAAAALRILYGGSMKPANAAELVAQPDVDGGLIGGASLDLDSFSAMIRAASARTDDA
jgi:triosephosphate isomerase